MSDIGVRPELKGDPRVRFIDSYWNDVTDEEELSLETFHLPGQHDQQSHASGHLRPKQKVVVKRRNLGGTDITTIEVGEDYIINLRRGDPEGNAYFEQLSDEDFATLEKFTVELASRYPEVHRPENDWLNVHSNTNMETTTSPGAYGLFHNGQRSSPPTIDLDPDNISRADRRHSMPAGKAIDRDDLVGQMQYTFAHEWGHALEDVNVSPRKLTKVYLENKGTLSEYGLINPTEAYGEAFAEFYLTNGTTTNEAAQAYAREFGW